MGRGSTSSTPHVPAGPRLPYKAPEASQVDQASEALRALEQIFGRSPSLGEAGDIEGAPAFAADVRGCIDQNALILARHGIGDAARLQAEVNKALCHDTVMSVLQAIVGNSGYMMGLPAFALDIAPRNFDVISHRTAFVGGATVAATILSSMVAGGLTGHTFAAGPEASLPTSVANRAAPLERVVASALYAAVHDAFRQLIPVGLTLNDWRIGDAVKTAVVNPRAVRADAYSRNLSALVSALRVLNGIPGLRGVGVSEPTYTERFLLQPSEKLDAWLTKSHGQSAFQSLKPTWDGAGRSALGIPAGVAHALVHLPAVTAMVLMGAAMISVGLLAAGGRSNEYASNRALQSGFEDPRARVERQAIFSWACETPLEFGLVVIVPLIGHLLNGGWLGKATAAGDRWIDQKVDATVNFMQQLLASSAAANQ